MLSLNPSCLGKAFWNHFHHAHSKQLGHNRKLILLYGLGGHAAAQAACLIRDTMKVTGLPQPEQQDRHALPPPTAAMFWVDPADPEAGGTGHTIRVCRLSGVPVVFQNDWRKCNA